MNDPFFALLHVGKSVVEPRFAALPELEIRRRETVATPVVGPKDGLSLEELFHVCFKFFPSINNLALGAAG